MTISICFKDSAKILISVTFTIFFGHMLIHEGNDMFTKLSDGLTKKIRPQDYDIPEIMQVSQQGWEMVTHCAVKFIKRSIKKISIALIIKHKAVIWIQKFQKFLIDP